MLHGTAEDFVVALASQIASTTVLSDVVLNGGSEADRVVDAAISTVEDEELQQLLVQLGGLVLEVSNVARGCCALVSSRCGATTSVAFATFKNRKRKEKEKKTTCRHILAAPNNICSHRKSCAPSCFLRADYFFARFNIVAIEFRLSLHRTLINHVPPSQYKTHLFLLPAVGRAGVGSPACR